MASKLILDTNEILQQGATGAKVQQLQEILTALNLQPGKIDGDFGAKTLAAVKQFQQQQGLTPDGIVGKKTQDALNRALEKLTEIGLYGGVTGKLPLPGVNLIKEFEGCFLNAYPDPLTKGKPYTIGWGSTRKKDGSEWKLGETITQQEADDLLIFQLENNYLPPLQKIPVWNELNVNQQGALLSFGYNLGANFYGNRNFQSITRVLANKLWDEIEETFVKYRNPKSPVEAGLKRRRLAEAKLFLTPVS
ncbi:lysozyme [Richelia sinica FACHB-800]|uniref:Lysozyme n=1 Tax=Richelia sinica FACHB-800 TaxID=1357546 RepID=A0A975TDI1_9NOST|nr:peptidoglycan-binding protein [Richelia sinica]MBD2667503.1 peptidoglycan-binding protein [Richelia sinica FACHB-800]QXE26495.1 lysozyme [Richelia sinica FACHB-800]